MGPSVGGGHGWRTGWVSWHGVGGALTGEASPVHWPAPGGSRGAQPYPARVADLVAQIRAGLRERADPVRAPQAQAYMRSAMPFLGVPVPEVRRLVRALAAQSPPADLGALEADARRLWDDAVYREERYAASGITGLRAARGRWELVPLHRHMIVTGAWWDHVDETAHRIADLHDAHPDRTAALVRGWATDDDLWLRRAAILGQLGRRDRVDADLLADVIGPNLEDREFFVRKAIGWALREYARVRPDWVLGYVDAHADRISPLSRREALKHLQARPTGGTRTPR